MLDAEVQKWRFGLPRRFESRETLIRSWNNARGVPEAVTICEPRIMVHHFHLPPFTIKEILDRELGFKEIRRRRVLVD
jgi:hypothetical protein